MSIDEVRKYIAENPAVFYKIWAAPKPTFASVVEYRFPGLSFSGYFVESESHLMTFIDWLNVEKIEVW